jgi:hypothetical protein
MTKTTQVTVVALTGLTILATLLPAGFAAEPTFSVTGLWESKYISEGRNNLENGGLFSVDGNAEWHGATLGVWFATGDRESYEELNLSLEYGFSAGPVDAYIGYTRLEFLEEDENDNELSAGISISGLPWVIPGLDYTYATEAEGGFLELSLRAEIALQEERITIEPYILEGFDCGYASEEYDGANNLQVGLDITLALTDQVRILASVAHSWAHKDVENEDLGDEFWGGVRGDAVGLSAVRATDAQARLGTAALATSGQLPVQDDRGGGCAAGEVPAARQSDGARAVGGAAQPVHDLV